MYLMRGIPQYNVPARPWHTPHGLRGTEAECAALCAPMIFVGGPIGVAICAKECKDEPTPAVPEPGCTVPEVCVEAAEKVPNIAPIINSYCTLGYDARVAVVKGCMSALDALKPKPIPEPEPEPEPEPVPGLPGPGSKQNGAPGTGEQGKASVLPWLGLAGAAGLVWVLMRKR